MTPFVLKLFQNETWTMSGKSHGRPRQLSDVKAHVLREQELYIIHMLREINVLRDSQAADYSQAHMVTTVLILFSGSIKNKNTPPLKAVLVQNRNLAQHAKWKLVPQTTSQATFGSSLQLGQEYSHHTARF